MKYKQNNPPRSSPTQPPSVTAHKWKNDAAHQSNFTPFTWTKQPYRFLLVHSCIIQASSQEHYVAPWLPDPHSIMLIIVLATRIFPKSIKLIISFTKISKYEVVRENQKHSYLQFTQFGVEKVKQASFSFTDLTINDGLRNGVAQTSADHINIRQNGCSCSYIVRNTIIRNKIHWILISFVEISNNWDLYFK